MKQILGLFSVSFCLILNSCNPDDPPGPDIYKWNTEVSGGGIITRCCLNAGTDCSKVFFESFRVNTTFMGYLERNELSSYFQNENWQVLFPELVGQSDLVNNIIYKNPKGVFLSPRQLVLLKNPNLPYSSENFLHVFVDKAASPCDSYPAQ